MAAEARTDVHYGAPRCLLRLFDAAAEGHADWSEFDAEAERWDIEVRGLSREVLTALIEGSTREIPTTQHRRLHQEASDLVRWGRRGGLRTLALYGRAVLLAARQVPPGPRWARYPYPAPCWEFKGGGSQRPALAYIIMVSVYTIGEGGGW
jgi:hypothetical protein